MPSSRSVVWLVIGCVLCGARPSGASGQEEPPANGPNAAGPPAGAPVNAPPTDAYRPLGPEVFPLYQHYLRTVDNTEVLNILYLFASTSNPNGSTSTLLAPLFFHARDVESAEQVFFLFPLLYFHKDSPDESYNYSIPFFFDRRTPTSSTQFLVPLWLRTAAEGVTQHNVLFPLFRYTSDVTDPEAPVQKTRSGIWKVLELWESRSEPGTTDYRALNLFNWREETQGGLPLLFSYSWAQDGQNVDGSTYLFPFYWHGEYLNSRYRWIVPFYGYSEGPGEKDYFLLPLLSRFGGSNDGERRLDILFPLFHYADGPKLRQVASFPLYGYFRNDETTSWTVGFWPYWTTLYNATGKRTHSIFYPLSHFDVEPDASHGRRWFFPYIETFNTRRLWRFVLPLYYEYQALAGGSMDWFFRTGLPLFWSWGYPEDSFSMGIPFYWAMRDGPRGWHVFFPFYLDAHTAGSKSVHILPLVSYRSLPTRTQLILGGPLFFHETFYSVQKGADPVVTGYGNHFLWPLFGVEQREDGHLYRFMPFFATSRDGDTSSMLISPFYYQQTSPRGTHRYIIPFYGRQETPRVTRDFYAFASYIRTRETDEEGSLLRDRSDVLWSLLSFETDVKTGASHQHVLPVGYWRTRTAPEEYEMAVPFYYHHRIADGEEDHYLSLILGNVFFSKTIMGPPPEVAVTTPPAAEAPPTPPAAAPSSDSPAAPTQIPPPAAAASTGLSPLAAPPERQVYWSDRGVLWPLSRWYQAGGKTQGKWVMPFYFDLSDELSKNFALFPFYFRQEEETPYNPSYFRYFFLYDHETWRGGYRYTVGQLLFDWQAEPEAQSYRWRFLYPLVEHAWNRDGRTLQITPLFRMSRREGVTSNWLFPFYWEGGTERKLASGETRLESRHFFIFPLFGVHRRQTRADYYALFPLFHAHSSDEAFRFELWPAFFYRNETSLFATRLWPLHAEEHGLTAGEFWVSRYLFLSKRFQSSDESSYRLDPFLFRTASGKDHFSIGGLFELMAYNREATESSFRIIPLVFGYSSVQGSNLGVLPFYYEKDFGRQEIDYLVPWRFLFLTHHLVGSNGERHTGVLWKLFESTSNPNRPDYRETGFLYRFVFYRTTETSQQFQVNPLFSYFHDATTNETIYSVLGSLYQYRTTNGRSQHTLFFGINF